MRRDQAHGRDIAAFACALLVLVLGAVFVARQGTVEDRARAAGPGTDVSTATAPTAPDWSATETSPTAPQAERVDASAPGALEGTWLAEGSDGWIWEFREDGQAYFRDPHPYGAGRDLPQPYRVVRAGTGADVLVLPDRLCDFEVRLFDDGRAQLQVVRAPDQPQGAGLQAACPLAVGDTAALLRLSPASEAARQLRWNPEPGQEVAVTTVTRSHQLPGVWLQQGTGRLLHLTTDGDPVRLSYRLDDGGAVFAAADDTGTAELGAGTLALRSESGACAGAAPTQVVGVRIWEPVPFLPGRGLELRVAEPPSCPAHRELAGIWTAVS